MGENSDIKKAKEELERIKQDEKEQYLAELRLKHIRDSHAIEEYGYDKGKKEGLKEGEEKGKREKQKEIVINMLKKKMSIEDISEIVNLSKEDVEKIIEKNK